MTDQVNVSPDHVGEPLENARTFRLGGHSPGWVVPDTETVLADVRSELAAGPYNAFAESHSASSYDVTIDTGEAIVGGVPLARDTTTTVTLDANTTGQTVYVGWAEGALDTVIIGTSGDFLASNPKIPIWEFDTDGSGVTASRDQRDIDSMIEVRNKRYEGGGTKVDAAKSADEIAGVTISDLIRGDQDDRTSGTLGFEKEAAVTGTLGNGSGEWARAGGGTSDLVFHTQGGHGRVAIAWNAYYDNVNDVWRSIVGGEPHAAITMNNNRPGDGTSTPSVSLATGPANANADETVAWEYIAVDENGDLDMYGNQIRNFHVDKVDSRPSNPSPGRLIYRRDKD